MYEDMTYETIMRSMMEDMPDGVDTSEGSLIFNACAKQAVRLEEAYLLLSGLGAAHLVHLEALAAPEDVLLGDELLPDLGVSACFPVLPSRSYCFEDGTPE